MSSRPREATPGRKLWGVYRFELGYQVRRPWPWLIALVLMAIAFLMTRDAAMAEAMYDEFLVNGPFNSAITTVVCGLFWLLAAASIAGDAAARDLSTGMYPLLYTAPIGRTAYLGGRFLAAWTLNALLLLLVQAACLLGVYGPGVNPQLVGPFRPEVYLTSYAYIALPNALAATAIQFWLALRSGRAMSAYLGSLVLIFTGFFLATLLNFLVQPALGSLLDPIGINLVAESLAHLWTSYQKNHGLLTLSGILLANRLLWIGVGVGVCTLIWYRFRFAHRMEAGRRGIFRRRAAAPPPSIPATPATPVVVPVPVRRFGFALEARKAVALAGIGFRTLASGWAGRILLLAVPAMTVLILLDQMSSLGVPMVPRTAIILQELTGGLSAGMASEPSRWIIVPLFIVFFAGELVWRERETGISEITDAMPGSDWTPLVGKLLGIGLTIALFLALLTVAGMLAQTILGYHHYQIGLYLEILFGLQLPEYLLFAVLALTVHVLVNHKYIAHLIAILGYAFIAVLAGRLGLEHNLLVYLRGPAWMYTDMRGFAGTVLPWLWFKLYWLGWAVLLAVLARLLWVRGREGRLGARIGQAVRRVRRPTAWTTAAGAAMILGFGGFVFYNTNLLNVYRSSGDIEDRRAEYERRYRRYEDDLEPRLTGAGFRIELHPGRRAAEIRGTYQLVNAGTQPIDSIHLTTPAGSGAPRSVSLDRPATLALLDADLGYRIYVLDRALEPGDTLRLEFETRIAPRGFGNYGANLAIAANGTVLDGADWFPLIGYQRSRELLTPPQRRRHGLEPRPVLAALQDSEEGTPVSRGGGVMFEAVIGTDPDQVAVAPGALQRSWTENGRRYFHYRTSAPISDEWAFYSARYAVEETHWKDVTIRLYHNPEHGAYVPGAMRSIRASLDYYTSHFGPYLYDHLAIIESPVGSGTGAHAEPAVISHGQGFSSWVADSTKPRPDLPFFVMAHELAHQWTVRYALVEGLPFLAEGLATYAATEVLRAEQGETEYRRLLRFMRLPFPYPPIRHGEPLLRALDPYMARRKGPFAMRALAEYAGRAPVNQAIRRLVAAHDRPDTPPATTLDLYRELQAVLPDSVHPLLHDLFAINASWDFATRRAAATPAEGGSWQVTLDLRAHKVMYDSTGQVSELPVQEWVQIGVSAPVEEGQDPLSAPLYLEWHRVEAGDQAITVTVPGRPALAGIDPYHVLDWEQGEEGDDNLGEVRIED